MPPSLSPTSGTPAARAASVRPSTSCVVFADSASKKPGCVISFSVASPQAVATGLPLSVPAWYTGPSGASWLITSLLAPKAASGMPPPMTLPNTLMSGLKPGINAAYTLCAPPSATRKPVITSSKTSSAPCACTARAAAS